MDIKKCSICKLEKPISEFHKKTKKYHSAYCKPCFSAYCVNRWIKRKITAINNKGGKCQICGYNKNYAALEFHHRDPSTKEMQWNKTRLVSEEKMNAELEKCDLICRNCHAELHHPQAMLNNP